MQLNMIVAQIYYLSLTCYHENNWIPIVTITNPFLLINNLQKNNKPNIAWIHYFLNIPLFFTYMCSCSCNLTQCLLGFLLKINRLLLVSFV